MAIRATWVALVISSLPLAGCGTVANLAHPGPVGVTKVPFGGVRKDVAGIEGAANGESCLWTQTQPEQRPLVLPMLLFAADLPLSLIGDVVTWPYTAAYTFINEPVPVPLPVPPPPPPPPVLPAGAADGPAASP